DGAARQRFRDRELIEVERVVVVDRAPEKSAQVPRARRGGRRRRAGRGRELPLDLTGEVGPEVAVDHGLAGDVLQVGAVVSGLAVHRRTLREAAGSSKFKVQQFDSSAI